MAEHEYYRLDLVVSATGDEQTKGKLKAMNKFIEQTRKRGEMLNRMKISPAVRLQDRISAPLRAIEGKLKDLSKRTVTVAVKAKDMIGNILSKLTSPVALLGTGAGVTALIGFPLRLAGEFEQAEIAMEFFNGSLEKGQKFLKELSNFAAKTPFEFPFIEESAIGLMGVYKEMMGVDKAAKETMRTIKAFGNAAGYTGAGVQGMEMAMLGFRQIGMVGSLQMEELRQVTENLRIPMSLITKELGLSKEELKDLGNKGIPAAKAMEAIVRALEREYAGGMDKLSRSLFGLVSTVKDTARFTVMAFGKGMADPVKRILTDIVGSTDYTSKEFEQFMQKVEDVGRRVGRKFEDMYSSAKKFFDELSKDQEFQKADWSDKICIALDKAIDKIYSWLNGPGGKKVEKVFAKLGEIAVKAWWTALTGMAKGSGEALLHGNIAGALGLGAGAYMLGGGLLLKGTWGLGKRLAGTGLGKAVKTTMFGEDILKAVGGVSEAAEVATTTKAATEVATATKEVASTTKAVSMFSKGLSKLSKVAGKAALPLAVATEAIDIARAKDKLTASFRSVGGLGGMFAGAKMGGMIGTAVLPGIGTAIGAGIGGIGGYLLGRFAGGKVAGAIRKPSTATGAGDTAQYLNAQVYEPFREYVNRATSWGRNLIRNFMRGRDSAGMNMTGWLNTKVYLPFANIVSRATLWGRNMMLNFVAGMQQVKVPPISVPRVTIQAAQKTKIAAHAFGGILTRPHVAMVAEQGPESIVPLSSNMRNRALAIWEETGRRLGVRPYAEGGFAGPVPAVSSAGAFGENINVNVTVAGITVHATGNELDEDALALRIGRYIVGEIRKALENKT